MADGAWCGALRRREIVRAPISAGIAQEPTAGKGGGRQSEWRRFGPLPQHGACLLESSLDGEHDVRATCTCGVAVVEKLGCSVDGPRNIDVAAAPSQGIIIDESIIAKGKGDSHVFDANATARR